MLTKALIAIAFFSLLVIGYGFLDALGAAETAGDAGLHAARNGYLMMFGGAVGFVSVCALGIWRWLARKDQSK